MVFEFSWQIGAGENSQIPVKSSTIHSPSNDTIFVSGNDKPHFLSNFHQLIFQFVLCCHSRTRTQIKFIYTNRGWMKKSSLAQNLAIGKKATISI